MLKKLILPIIFCLLSTTLRAQIVYKRFGAGVEGGATISFMDAAGSNVSSAFGVMIEANMSPYSFFKLEFQKGKLIGGTETSVRKFTNKYGFIGGTYNQGLGDLLHFNINKKRRFYNYLYFGAGIGVFLNDVTEVKPYVVGDFTEGFNSNNTEVVLPINIGYNYKYYTRLGLNPFNVNINYQFVGTLSDVLDGYEGAPGNKHYDFYSFISLGIKYNFGNDIIYYRIPFKK